MKIILKPDEVAVCRIIGQMRSLIARSAGVKDMKIGPQEGDEADIVGLIAEYAFAKQFNVFPDLGLSPRSGSADGIIKGKRYDIKATTYKSGKLLCTVKDNPDVDVYILAIVSNNEVNVVGWEYKENLRKDENLIDLGHGKGYALTQDKLQSFN